MAEEVAARRGERSRSSETEGYKVFVNVYDVTNAQSESTNSMVVRLNNVTHHWGVGGVFHGAIEVEEFDLEWSFGYCDQGTGVYCCQAQKNTMYQFRQRIDVGTTSKTKHEFKMILHKLKREWEGSSYELLSRNCCHFCETLCIELECNTPPTWLNRFAQSAEATVAFTNDAATYARNVSANIQRTTMWLLGRSVPEEGAMPAGVGETRSMLNPGSNSLDAAILERPRALATRSEPTQGTEISPEQQQQQLKAMHDIGLRIAMQSSLVSSTADSLSFVNQQNSASLHHLTTPSSVLSAPSLSHKAPSLDCRMQKGEEHSSSHFQGRQVRSASQAAAPSARMAQPASSSSQPSRSDALVAALNVSLMNLEEDEEDRPTPSGGFSMFASQLQHGGDPQRHQDTEAEIRQTSTQQPVEPTPWDSLI